MAGPSGWKGGKCPTRDEGGKLVSLETIIRDITEDVRLKEALHMSEINFRNTMDNSPLGVCIVTADGEAIYTNQRFLDMYGYENLEEFRSKPVEERYTPESYQDYLVRREKLQQGQEKLYKYYRVSIVRKDGAIRHLEVFRKEVLWDGKQQYQLLYNDITERKQAEEALKASEQNFRNSMDSSSMGIRIMGDADYTLYANQALLDMFGYKISMN